MKHLLVTLLLILISSVTYSQTGVGYLNYMVYNIRNNGVGAYANNATDFVNMFDLTKGAVVFASGTTTAQTALNFQNQWRASSVPNGGAYTGIKIEGYFVPKESGTYSFGIDGDDGVDFSLDGNVVTSFYGAHGFGGYRFGSVNLIAGKSYKFMARYQNWGGGWGMYLLWKRPSQSTYAIQSDEVYSTKPSDPSKKANATFNLNGLDATKFSIGGNALSSTGMIDITNSLDSNKVVNGNKATIVSGQVEWSMMNLWNGVNYVFIDARKLNGVQPTDVKQVKILDLYEGPVTFYSYDGTWAVYSLPVLVSKLSDGTSIYNSLIRPFGIYYGLSCDISFSSVQQYKPQSITLTTTNNLSTLYNSIVTVSDVYLAFKELANGGLFGNQSGNEFTYGIQYKNADINNDGIFDESDTYRLLQHLTGASNIVDLFTLPTTIRLIPTSTYNTIDKLNWNSISTPLNDTYSFDINTNKATDSFDISVAWKGDVNLSHSSIPTLSSTTPITQSVGMRTMNLTTATNVDADVMTELVGGKVIATIKINPNLNELVGTQFKVDYDNTLLKYEKTEFITKNNPTNYASNEGYYINVGSLNMNGGVLDNTTEYKITFTPQTAITDILGLISFTGVDVVVKTGTQIKIKIN